MNFNLYAQINKELQDYFTNKVKIAGSTVPEGARYLRKADNGYTFSQNEMINLIDLYYNSKFESGIKDAEGQRKIFLNTCKFRADVASKQIDIDVKDFNFVPEPGTSQWDSFFLQKEFQDWAKTDYFGELLNTWVEKFPRYGWIIAKEVNGKLEDVPLQTIRNQQDAKSIKTASYFIIEHPEMTLGEMEAMKGWDTKGLSMKFGDTQTVYERYGHVPLSFYKEQMAKYNENDTEYEIADGDEEKTVDCVVICALTESKTKDNPQGNILFIEQISERPFREAHWSKQHGRLMGIGEIENQIENQIGSNLAFNFYRRQLMWSSKKIFQSTAAEGLNKSLVRDVKDGDVLQVGVNGQLSQVNMSNQSSGDFVNFSKILEQNADQKSFTYEVATGESLPSGTPFRLGVVLSNAVNSHFDLKREKLGLFLNSAIMDLILPTWKKTFSKEHTISMFADEEGFDALKELIFHINLNNSIKEHLFEGKMPDVEALKVIIQEQLDKERFLFVKLPDNYYKEVKSRVTLVITGEQINLPKKIETLTNLYTTLAQRGDPRADKVLARILAYAGENYDVLVGKSNKPQLPSLPVTSPQINSSNIPQPTNA